MIKTTEINVLHTLLRHLDVQSESIMQSRWLIVALWPVVAVWFFVLFQLEPKIGSLGISVGSMLAGAGVATVAIYRWLFPAMDCRTSLSGSRGDCTSAERA